MSQIKGILYSESARNGGSITLVCEDSKDFSPLFLSPQGTNGHKISNGSDFIGIGVTRKAKVAITRAESSVFYNEIFFRLPLSSFISFFLHIRKRPSREIRARYYFIEFFFFTLARKLHALYVKGFSPTHGRLRDINFIRT